MVLISGDRSKRNIPPYVYQGKGRWFHREYLGNGKFGREVRLADASATDDEIWKAYLNLMKSEDCTGSLSWLADRYLNSEYFEKRAPKTRTEYLRYAKKILETPMKNGKQFGSVRVRDITPGAIRKYMDRRASSAPVIASRELEFLSVIFSYGYERDYLDNNPARGVKPQVEKPRARYVTDEEYQSVFVRAPDYLQLAMEFAYLCRLTRGEIIGPDLRDISENHQPEYTGLLRKHVLNHGLHVIRSKGSKQQIIAWTPRLRATVDNCRRLPGAASTQYLIHNRRGQRIRKAAFSSAWQRTMKKAIEESGIERFTFHDLKAKGVSDFKGDKLKASGHKSMKMVGVYDRLTETIEPTR